MKNLTFDEARTRFESIFDLAAGGEMIVIARNDQRVAIHSLKSSEGSDVAPPGYFEHDYDADEIAELNSFASHGPQAPIP
jgi:hypothetical protein